jgi:formate-dependent nitrite reductase membrane component NrfD
MEKEMNSDDKFWLSVCGMGLAVLVTLMVCITVNAHGKRDKWEKAVSNGADPMVVACALDGVNGYAETAICVILAQGRK